MTQLKLNDLVVPYEIGHKLHDMGFQPRTQFRFVAKTDKNWRDPVSYDELICKYAGLFKDRDELETAWENAVAAPLLGELLHILPPTIIKGGIQYKLETLPSEKGGFVSCYRRDRSFVLHSSHPRANPAESLAWHIFLLFHDHLCHKCFSTQIFCDVICGDGEFEGFSLDEYTCEDCGNYWTL